MRIPLHCSPTVSHPFLAVLLLLAGCAVEVKTRFDTQASFKNYKTYCWIEGCGTPVHSSAAERDTALEKRMRGFLISELEVKGLRPTAADPDLLIALRVTTSDEQTMVYNRPNDVRMQWPAPTETQVLHYTKGTVVVAMADPRTGHLVWESNALSYMDVRPEISDKNLRRAVRSILMNYPPDTETPRKRTNAVY